MDAIVEVIPTVMNSVERFVVYTIIMVFMAAKAVLFEVQEALFCIHVYSESLNLIP